MESAVESVLLSMSSVKKPQRLFLSALFSALMVFQGKATFRNLSRYSSLHEKRLSRWFRRSFDFAQFNRRLLQKELPQKHDQIAAIAASFMKKSGQKTAGLGWFYNGALGQAMMGLDVLFQTENSCGLFRVKTVRGVVSWKLLLTLGGPFFIRHGERERL